MLDAETLRTIHNMPIKERIALIVALIASLDPHQAQSIQPVILSLINSWQSQFGEIQAPQHWQTLAIREIQQAVNLSEQPQRPAFGFMKGTGSIPGSSGLN